MDAVGQVLRREGLARLTTNRIASRAGVSIGSLYQYFRDKEAILVALRDRHEGEMAAMIEDALLARAAPAESLDRIIGRLFDSMVEAHARDREVYEHLLRAVPQGAGTEGSLDRRVERALRLAVQASARDLDEGLDVERLLFVLRPVLESLAHAVALWRPVGISRAAATEEAARLIRSYVSSYRRS